ncbi:hypothetical protein DQ384_05445 [Sphaerisporangium album]|uniref:Uncharacterized protein n=1 Tax=Sphaerisporangium album TaxID=509200 RepID=A0A367FQJ8_9ACTN|nr:hypothetical protein [Sphaerisporangium album]RCG31987.1 hypothetical protein DQ384_05445 [Sphaerisporangium album]
MARRMIPVRNKETGVTALVSERAWPLFAASHERLDQDNSADAAPDDPGAPPASEASSPAPQATTHKPQRRGAASDSKE